MPSLRYVSRIRAQFLVKSKSKRADAFSKEKQNINHSNENFRFSPAIDRSSAFHVAAFNN